MLCFQKTGKHTGRKVWLSRELGIIIVHRATGGASGAREAALLVIINGEDEPWVTKEAVVQVGIEEVPGAPATVAAYGFEPSI